MDRHNSLECRGSTFSLIFPGASERQTVLGEGHVVGEVKTRSR